MTQHNVPDVITRASLTNLGPGPGAGAGPGPGPVDEWESLFHFLERFEGHLTRIFGMIQRVKALEQRGEVIGPVRESHQNGKEKGQDLGPNVGAIPPIKAYQVALGLLAGLPEDTTVKTMLEFARGNKDIVLVQLEDHLKKLQGG